MVKTEAVFDRLAETVDKVEGIYNRARIDMLNQSAPQQTLVFIKLLMA